MDGGLAALVRTLAVTIGPRSYNDLVNLNVSADFISCFCTSNRSISSSRSSHIRWGSWR